MPTFAVSSRAQLSYIKETVFGTTPGAGNGRNLRMTGESLNFDLSKEDSKEIRNDRQTVGASTVDASAQGGFNFHLQYSEYDQFMEGALQNTFGLYGTNGVGTTFTATFATGSITAAVAPTGTSDFTAAVTGLQCGQWFKMVAPANANDGKFFRVHPTTAPTTTVITLDASTPATAGAGVANCAVATARLTNGSVQPSFTLEKSFTDVTQFLTYRGMTVNKMALNFSAAALTDGSFDFMGKDAVRNIAKQLPGALTASNAFEIQNGVKGVGVLWEGTAPITSTSIKTFSVNVENNLRGQKALGTLGNVSIGSGDFDASGSMEVYFADGTQFDKFLSDTYTQLIIGSNDVARNGYVLSFPRVMLMNAKVVAGSKNADIMATFDWMAFADTQNAIPALRQTMFVDRCGVAAAP
jgi:hypothetical protein